MKADGIGGAELAFVYPEVLDDPAKGLKNLPFLSPEMLDAVTYAQAEGRRLGLRIDVTLCSGWPYGGPAHHPRGGCHAAPHHRGCRAPPCDHASRRPGARRKANPLHLRGRIVDRRTQPPQRARPQAAAAAPPAPAPGTPPPPSRRLTGTSHLAASGTPRVAVFFVASHTAPAGQARRRRRRRLRARSLHPRRRRHPPASRRRAAGQGLRQPRRPTPSSPTRSKPTAPTGPRPARRVQASAAAMTSSRTCPSSSPEARPQPTTSATTTAAPSPSSSTRTTSRRSTTGPPRTTPSSARRPTASPPSASPARTSSALAEGEGPQWRAFSTLRWATSANHVFGNNVTSGETFTWLHSPVFRATPLDMKTEADIDFIMGENQLIFHGWPYSAARHRQSRAGLEPLRRRRLQRPQPLAPRDAGGHRLHRAHELPAAPGRARQPGRHPAADRRRLGELLARPTPRSPARCSGSITPG